MSSRGPKKTSRGKAPSVPDHEAVTVGVQFDEIGYWSQIKLDIVKDYAQAYATILATKNLRFSYIDGFAGAGTHLVRSTKQLVPGSPLNALSIEPPFAEYFLVDLNGDKVDRLRSLPEVKDRANVHVIHGDCNQVLLEQVFPKVRFEDYRRALCVLDPYGLHLNWGVIETAGKMKSIEIFLNLPIMDMNRNALWRKPELATREGQERMTAFWGDESWKAAAHRKQPTLFGDDEDVKQGNRSVVDAFAQRLKSVAGFSYVPEPLPMRNSTNAVVYYLFFASHQPVASKIVQDIVKKYKNRRGG
jgi:three-Cys-motif partner protein